MESDPVYYYDLLAKQWWQYVPEDKDWTLVPRDKADAINLDAHLANLEENVTPEMPPPDKPPTPKEDTAPSPKTPTEESQNVLTNDINNTPEKPESARNNTENVRATARKVSYVREAARRLTYKGPGGFADSIKVVAETRDEMLKNATKDDFEPKKDDSKLKFMIKRAQEMAKTTLQNNIKIDKLDSTEIKEIDHNKILKKKISKELNSPSDSDGDFSSADSDTTTSTDSHYEQSPIEEVKTKDSPPPSLAQLMSIKMRLAQKIKNRNK